MAAATTTGSVGSSARQGHQVVAVVLQGLVGHRVPEQARVQVGAEEGRILVARCSGGEDDASNVSAPAPNEATAPTAETVAAPGGFVVESVGPVLASDPSPGSQNSGPVPPDPGA